MNSSALLSGLSSKLYGLTEGKISEGLTSIATRIKSFIPEKKLLPITTIVEAIMDPINASQQSVQLTDEYVYLDPKSRGGHSKPPKDNLIKNHWCLLLVVVIIWSIRIYKNGPMILIKPIGRLYMVVLKLHQHPNSWKSVAC